MQMLQDGVYATAPEKPLRMTGSPEACRVSYHNKQFSAFIYWVYVIFQRARELVIELIEQKELEASYFTASLFYSIFVFA